MARSVSKAHSKDQLKLLWLNFQEVVPAVFVAIFFGTQLSDAERPVAVYLAIALVIAVGGYLVIGSIRHHRADRQWDASMRSQLAQRLSQVEHRVRLYRSVLWWYIVPLSLAALLLRYGVGGDQAPLLAYVLLLVALGVFVYFLNRWYSRKHYEPEVERFRSLLQEFDRVPQHP